MWVFSSNVPLTSTYGTNQSGGSTIMSDNWDPAVIESSELPEESNPRKPEKPAKPKCLDSNKEKLRTANVNARARRLEILANLHQCRRQFQIASEFMDHRIDKMFITSGMAMNLKPKNTNRNESN